MKTEQQAAAATSRCCPALYREAAIVAGSLDEKQRTFDVLWTAGAEVARMDWYTGQRYIEVLEVSDKAIRSIACSPAARRCWIRIRAGRSTT
jgi:hypothetical protein